ncbi:MAG: type II toxin-antitoxin system VapC family toxin [Hyphomicrobiaceae bacterium]|nr:type II toxin-antitoxin system VapC family toxin [Hyphomicrobiaceae bacterium]
MTYLLDTHILLALADLGDARISPAMLTAMQADDAKLQVGAVSLWEIAIKARSGKLNLGMALSKLPELCSAASATIIPITPQHVIADLTVVPPTRDPFDLLLLAVAQVDGLRLVTLDRALADHPLVWRQA